MSDTTVVGNICIADEVICVLVGMAISETTGVCLSQNSGVTDFIGKRKLPKGIQVTVSDESVSIEVSIAVEYGNRIRAVAEQVQRAISDAIVDMTGMNVASVDVHVQSVVMPKTEKEYCEEEEG